MHLIGCTLANTPPVAPLFFQYQLYLYSLKLLCISFVVNGCDANNMIAPLSLMILLYCFQSGTSGIILSHSQYVIPNGKSHKTISTLLSGIVCISSKQSPCNSCGKVAAPLAFACPYCTIFLSCIYLFREVTKMVKQKARAICAGSLCGMTFYSIHRL